MAAIAAGAGGIGLYIGLGLAAASVAASAYSAYASYQAAEAQARAIEYQKRQERINAKQARDAAAAAAEIAHDRHQRILAAQRAAFGGAGVTSSEGTSLILQADAAIEAKLDEERIRTAGVTQSTGFESNARLLNYRANTTRTSGYYSAGTSLLGSATNAYGTYRGA